MCVCVCVSVRIYIYKMSENPRDPLKEGCFLCAGNSLSGIRYICHMSVIVNYNIYCHRRYCVFTVTCTLT